MIIKITFLFQTSLDRVLTGPSSCSVVYSSPCTVCIHACIRRSSDAALYQASIPVHVTSYDMCNGLVVRHSDIPESSFHHFHTWSKPINGIDHLGMSHERDVPNLSSTWPRSTKT